MKFSPPLQQASLRCRYKRFLADIELLSGEIVTIHCPNTGAMTRCIVENSACWYSISNNPKRKYPFTWEIATTADGHLAGINSGFANRLVKEAVEQEVITELQGYDTMQAEVKYGAENSRIDFLLRQESKPDCYVEVKSVTLGIGEGVGLFPDAVSARGSKHLRELISMVQDGYRAVLIFCVQHTGIHQVSPADDIDSMYGQLLRQAIAMGVEVYVYGADINNKEITLKRKLALVV